MTVSPSPEQLSELDADSGMSGDAVAQAEMVWANLPTRNLPWTSLATHEKALVCHTLARLTADALESAQAEIARLNDRLVETQMNAHKWMEAHDKLKAGEPYSFPKPADLPDALSEIARLTTALRSAKMLCDNINEFGSVTDHEIFVGADEVISAALKGNQP